MATRLFSRLPGARRTELDGQWSTLIHVHNQADNEDVEDLGVRIQSAMAHAVTEIRRTTGRQIDLANPDHVLLDDQFAFALIQDSDTVGMFQLESPGQQDLVGRLQPRDPQDVIADISLFGPGPVLFPH